MSSCLHFNRFASLLRPLFACAMLVPVAAPGWEQGGPNDDGYTEEPMFWSRPGMGRKFELGPVGVTGLVIDIEVGKVLTVRETMADTPASGKFRPGEVLTAVNGTAFEGRDPQRLLGEALTAAEAADGRMVFQVRGEDGKPREVALTIPVTGPYQPTWPLDCAKSDAIVKGAAAYYGSDAFLKGPHCKSHSLEGALGCLFLLSTGDDSHLPKVKDYLAGARVDESNWHNGYNGILCAEYFLRTGDRGVLPLLQSYCDAAQQRQKFNSGWNHGGTGLAPRYVAGGLLNAAGNQILTTLLLAEECGAEVDRDTLLGGLRFLYRFAGRGTVPYGDHRGEGGLGSNGKDGMAAAAMQVACGARGEVTIYQKARDHLAMSMLTSYPVLVQGHGDEGRGDPVWRSITAAYLLEKKPELYHDTMNRLRWWFDLCRRPSGAFGLNLASPRFNTEGSGAAVALAFTAPRKTLRITGAPRSPHAREFSLPARLWGAPADLAFHSLEPVARYDKLAPDEPVYRPFFRFGSAYGKPRFDPATTTVPEILKWIGHPRYVIRAQAAKALRVVGGPAEIEKLLADPDPRVRRAGLDGWIDYNYWFGTGKEPVSGDRITPGMLAAVRRMLADPDESWWVVDGALMALSFAPAAAVQESLPLILPWTEHQEWWLRQSAFKALCALEQDERLFLSQMPTMIRILARETHTQPRQGMTAFFAKTLRKHADKETGRRILDGLLKAAGETTILPDKDGNLRSLEGKFNVYLALDAAANQAPESEMLRVAREVVGHFDSLGTGELVSLVASPNHNPTGGGRSGIYPAIERLPDDLAGQLKELLGGQYMPELMRRWQGDRANASLTDTVADLAKLNRPDAGWKPLGPTPPAERLWRHVALDLPGGKEVHRTPGGLIQNPQLPAAFKDWQSPAYDDHSWTQGRAPVGDGSYARKGSPAPFENRSAWGEGEFLLARTIFDHDGRAYAAYRLRVLAPRSYQVRLNGKPLHDYVWWQKVPFYAPIPLDDRQAALLRKGPNLLTIYLNRFGSRGPAQMDAVIEGLDLGGLETNAR